METFALCVVAIILAGALLLALYADSKYEAPEGVRVSYPEDSEDGEDEPVFSGAFPSYFDEMNTPAMQVCLFRNTVDGNQQSGTEDE